LLAKRTSPIYSQSIPSLFGTEHPEPNRAENSASLRPTVTEAEASQTNYKINHRKTSHPIWTNLRSPATTIQSTTYVKEMSFYCRLFLISAAGILLSSFCRAEEAHFEVKSLVVKREHRLPTLIEWPVKVEIKGSYLIASAEVLCTVPKDETWKVGYIQIITSNFNRQTYSGSYTEYQFDRYPFNDCTSDSAPLYASVTVSGKVSDFKCMVTMNDNTQQNITWRQLNPQDATEFGEPDLREFEREQKFTTWLVAEREKDQKLVLLKKFDWSSSWHAMVSPDASLGELVRFSPIGEMDPVIRNPDREDMNIFTEGHILDAKKESNELQTFVWYSKKDPSAPVRMKGNFNYLKQ
jgi:hypothetical protein